MLRVKVPAGKLVAARAARDRRDLEPLRQGDGELSTRQNIQLHWLELAKLPDVFAHLEAAGHDDRRRLRRHRAQHHRLPRPGPRRRRALRLQRRSSTRRPRSSTATPTGPNLPRKHKYSIAACADRCNAPEINCISLVGTVNDGREGFAVLVGGGLSSVPRIAQDMGVFVPKEDANEILGAITSVWSEDLKYRVSRVKARLKFMVDDIGPEGIRERVEATPRPQARGLQAPADRGRAVAPHGRAPAEAGGPLLHRRARSTSASSRGDQMIAIADLAERFGGDVRLTRQQNFIVTGVPNESVDEAVAELERIGFPLDINPVRGNSIACTGEPHCNFSVAETKTRLGRLIDNLEATLRRRRSPTFGSTSTAARTRARSTGSATSASRARRRATRAACAGRPTTSSCAAASGPSPQIGKSLFRRVPTDELDAAVEGLIAGWLDAARAGRDVHGVLAPPDRRRAWSAGRPRAGEEDESRRRWRHEQH